MLFDSGTGASKGQYYNSEQETFRIGNKNLSAIYRLTARSGPVCEVSTTGNSFVQIATRLMAAATVLLRGNQTRDVWVRLRLGPVSRGMLV